MSGIALAESPASSAPKPLYRKLQPCRNGLDRDAIQSDQRGRLMGAMIEVAGSDAGYAGANIKLLSALAGVSRQTFYDLFGTTEACFLATYRYVVGRAARRVSTAHRSAEAGEARLRAAFSAYASEVVAEPKAAHLALVEVLGAGPAALQERDRGRRVFEQMILASFREAPYNVELPWQIVKAIVGGLERTARQRLLDGSVDELPELADELLAWAVSYGSPATSVLAPDTKRVDWMSAARQPAGSAAGSGGERSRILLSAARLAATSGYPRLTAVQIVRGAGVSEEAFDRLFASVEQCFLEALDRLGLEALVCAGAAARDGEGGPAGVHRGIAALMGHLATNQVLVRIAFVEVFAVGRAGIRRRELLLARFTALLVENLPRSRRPSPVVAEAAVGAVWELIHHYVTHGATRQLQDLIGYATYLLLAPVIDAEAAVEVAAGR
jgi:AcrR family transcriptional regulator